MINKWKTKVVQRGLYNRRNPPWRENPGMNRESIVAISRTPITIFIQYLLEQNSLDCVENKLSLIKSVHLCLIVMNTILTVIHALKSSSLTHSTNLLYWAHWSKIPYTLSLGCKTCPHNWRCLWGELVC